MHVWDIGLEGEHGESLLAETRVARCLEGEHLFSDKVHTQGCWCFSNQ